MGAELHSMALAEFALSKFTQLDLFCPRLSCENPSLFTLANSDSVGNGNRDTEWCGYTNTIRVCFYPSDYLIDRTFYLLNPSQKTLYYVTPLARFLLACHIQKWNTSSQSYVAIPILSCISELSNPLCFFFKVI